jgi:Trypsin-like peptidase domain
VTIGDLIREGKLLEVHCGNCRPERHLYLNPEILRLPKRTSVPEVAGHLVCSKCGARNRETFNPIWARPKGGRCRALSGGLAASNQTNPLRGLHGDRQGMRERISAFPFHKPFEKQPADTPLSEVALRLVANFYTGEPRCIGTAFSVCGSVLVTARHVLEEFFRSTRPSDGQSEIEQDLVAIQLVMSEGVDYFVWEPFAVIADPASDLAVIHLAAEPARSPDAKTRPWRSPHIEPFAPKISDRVCAFGYREGRIVLSKNQDGGRHLDLNDEPMMSVGIVREVYEWRRDNVQLPFPCYQVNAQFDGGMSGGPVFDETGALCGVVCSGIEGAHRDGEPISYVSTLWPIFRLMLQANRGPNFPRDVRYPMIQLVRDGIIRVTDPDRLLGWFSKHIR